MRMYFTLKRLSHWLMSKGPLSMSVLRDSSALAVYLTAIDTPEPYRFSFPCRYVQKLGSYHVAGLGVIGIRVEGWIGYAVVAAFSVGQPGKGVLAGRRSG